VSPAVLSLIALLVAIALSMASKLNVGVLAMAFAWLIGTYVAGWRVEQVAAGFPSSLFLTLTGVTLLFALAESNGTLERLAHRAVGLARGRTRLIPILLFAIAFALSSVGPGAITTVALLIPMAMAVERAGVPFFSPPSRWRTAPTPATSPHQRHRDCRQHEDGRGGAGRARGRCGWRTSSPTCW
jgi:Na+/H+ antiporter NhaD/arsenite permease-like protein